MTARERVAERQADRLRLLGVLDDLRASGRPVPCWSTDLAARGPWTSDDPAEQLLAAVACVGCAAATDCGRYGQRWPDEFGVYGGATDAERRPRRGRRPKTSQTKEGVA